MFFFLDNETNSFSTITVVNKNMNNDTNDIDNSISTLVTMNYDIWKVNIFNSFKFNPIFFLL